MKNNLKKLRTLIGHIDTVIVKSISSVKILSPVYYLFKPNFWREQWGVISGRAKYYENIQNKKGNEFHLRRNIHRIEKGILMKPRKDVFAESYIMNTVENYLQLKEKNYYESTLKWAKDVLVNYFEVTDEKKSRILSDAKNKFYSYTDTDIESEQNENFVPYIRDVRSFPKISIEDLEGLAKYRRSVRWFLDKKIDFDIIDKSIDVASQSPSACNRLPYQYKVFQNKEDIIKIAGSAMGTSGYLNNIPNLIAIVGDLSAYPHERDRHLIYIDSSLSAMSFLYSLEVQGVSSCVINWPDIEKREKRISKHLNLKPYEKVTMLIAFGYADPNGMVAYSKKKDLKTMRNYERLQ
ncbi:nitroreductase family protein [Salinicoccus roseus]|uniref:nitroreductase family protein n=1 Tax=Salinicoccus roseus TaxID=45670 RepID=UPI003DA18EEB